MSQSVTATEAKRVLEQLAQAITRDECRSCDCLQGLITQIELDAAQDISLLTAPFKTPRAQWHSCLGCDPCPPGALFADYIRQQKQDQAAKQESGRPIRKAKPAADYPPEEGCYLRGNDYSPVAVVVILRWMREETPPEIENLVRVAIESGAALAGTLQTENIGLEKIICNLVANPNIRYLIVCGPESPGHLVGETILALEKNGVDADKRIIGTNAPTPYLFNLPPESIARLRKQVKVLDLVNEGSPEVLRQAIWSCYQEEPVAFKDYTLCDPGALPELPLSGKITWRVTRPEREPKSDEERKEVDKFTAMAQRIQHAMRKRTNPDAEHTET